MTPEQHERTLSRIAIFTGSSTGNAPEFVTEATRLATSVAKAGIGVVYGGGGVGLMGVVASSALDAGGTVHGVIPEALVDGEIAQEGLTALDVVPDMHARKMRMADLSDAFVALPGGAGTLEELFEAWTWQHLGYHSKPVALYDVNGYWQPLLRALDAMTASGFLSQAFRESLIVCEEPGKLLDALRTWKPLPRKWARPADADAS